MNTYWYFPGSRPSDTKRSDPYEPKILSLAIPPGIYCEDEGAYEALLATGKVRADLAAFSMFNGKPEEDRPLGWMFHMLDGIRIRVATEAEAKFLRSIEQKEPPPPPPDPLARIEEKLAKLQALMAPEPTPRQAGDPPATRHLFAGANRKAKRAAAAKARRRA